MNGVLTEPCGEACTKSSNVVSEIEITNEKTSELAGAIDTLQQRLIPIMLVEDKPATKDKQPDVRTRCNIDRMINENNEFIRTQIHRIRDIIESLQV